MKKILSSFLFFVAVSFGMLHAQEDKGITASGKEVDRLTIDTAVDAAVSEYGGVVPLPRLTRDGRIIYDIFSCPVSSIWMPSADDISHEHDFGNGVRIDSVYDHEGNAYTVVWINGHCLMRQNMRATTTPSGEVLQNVGTSSYSEKRYYQSANYGDEGYLYNWAAAMDIPDAKNLLEYEGQRGLCPKGWHVPTNSEWTAITNGFDAGQLAAIPEIGDTWTSNTNIINSPGYADDPDRNASGFSAFPVGWYKTTFSNAKQHAHFWSATSATTNTTAYDRVLYHNNAAISNTDNLLKTYGLSVRCMRDYPSLLLSSDKDGIATVKLCDGVQDVTYTASIVTSDEEVVPIRYRWSVNGVDSTSTTNELSCHFTTANTYNVSCVVFFSSTDSLEATITTKISGTSTALTTLPLCVEGSTVNVKQAGQFVLWGDGSRTENPVDGTSHVYSEPGMYKVTLTNASGCSISRNVVVDSVPLCEVAALNAGTARGGGKEFGDDNGRLYAVSDHEGNVYKTVQVGNHCWMAENMRATTNHDGDNIVNYSNQAVNSTNIIRSQTGQVANWYRNDEATYGQYGLLYNWNAAMDTCNVDAAHLVAGTRVASSAEGTTWNCAVRYRQGICPDGWHVADLADWADLADYTAGQLAGGCNWATSNGANVPGNYKYTERNSTGLNILPAGCFDYEKSGTNEDGSSIYTYSFRQYKNRSYFWLPDQSSTTTLATNLASAKVNYVLNSKDMVSELDFDRAQEASVRCVRDYPKLVVSSDKDGIILRLCNNAQDVQYKATVYAAGDLGSPVRYKWSVNNIDSTSVTSVLSCNYTVSGTYIVKCVAFFEDNSSLEDSVTVTIGSKVTIPALSLQVDGRTVTVKSAAKGGHVLWGDGVRTENPVDGTTHTYEMAGFYSLRFVTQNGCSIDRNIQVDTAISCVVATSLQDGTAIDDGKFADKEYGDSEGRLYAVSDHEGNMYRTVQVGEQCWLAENMRAITNRQGHNIVNPTNLTSNSVLQSNTGQVAHWYKNDEATYGKYGLLYNWCAAMDTFKVDASTLSSGTRVAASDDKDASSQWYSGMNYYQGICPNGWHVADEGDWAALSGYTAGQLVGGVDWTGTVQTATSQPCVYSYPDRGSTGLNMLPSGYWNPSAFYTNRAYFWLPTEYSNANANVKYFLNTDAAVKPTNIYKYDLASVRCVRNYPKLVISSNKDGIAELKLCNNAQDVRYKAAVYATGVLGSPVRYKWSVNNTDSASVTGVLSCHYTATGTYNVKCVAYFADNSSIENTVSVTIGANVTISSLPLYVDGRTVTVKLAASGGHVLWGDGVRTDNPVAAGTSHTYEIAGFYSLRFVTQNGCSIDRNIQVDTAISCVVATSLQDGLAIGDGKFADKEYGDTEGRLFAVSDHEGNMYRTVQVGSQCWLAENMRATTNRQGDNIVNPTNLTSNSVLQSNTGQVAHWYSNNQTTYGKYGLLYNWCAAMDTFKVDATTLSPGTRVAAEKDNAATSYWNCVLGTHHQGICPNGWHVADENDWTALSSYSAGQLAGGVDWTGSSTNNAPCNYSYPDRGSTGLNMLPSGYWNPSAFAGNYAYFWLPTEYSNANANVKYFLNTDAAVKPTNIYKYDLASVRCVRDAGVSVSSNATDTVYLCDKTDTAVTYTASIFGMDNVISYVWKLNGELLSASDNTVSVSYSAEGENTVTCTVNDGNFDYTTTLKTVILRGIPQLVVGVNEQLGSAQVVFQKDASSILWYNSSEQLVHSGNSIFDPHLDANSSITVTVVAVSKGNCRTTRNATIVHNVLSCPISSEPSNSAVEHAHWSGTQWLLDSISDNDGHTYHVVQIGSQCWMHENMKSTKAPDGTPYAVLYQPTEISYDAPTCFINTGADADYQNKYGVLYNWTAAANVLSSGNEVPLPIQGVCPQGWHLPDSSDFATLFTNILQKVPSSPGPDPAIITLFNQMAANTKLAVAIAGGHDWKYVQHTVNKMPAGDYEDEYRDVALFCARPASCWFGGDDRLPYYGYSPVKESALFWTATQLFYGVSALHLDISYNQSGIGALPGNKNAVGCSVRCVRN